MPKKHPWLHERGRTWYLRAKVPADLAAIFPSAEVKRSLKTQDRIEAARLINREAAIVEQLFDDYRRHGGPPPRPSTIVRHAKNFTPRYLGSGQPPVGLMSSERLSAIELKRMALSRWKDRQGWIDEPVFDLTMQQRHERADQYDLDAAQNASSGDECWSAMFKKACEALESAGYFFDQSGSKAMQLGELLLRAETEALKQRAVRLRGDAISAPFDLFFAQVDFGQEDAKYKSGKTLDGLIALYEHDPERQGIVNKTRIEDRRTFALLREVFGGDLDISQIDRSACIRFKTLICSLPKNAQLTCRGMTAAQAVEQARSRNLPKLSAKGSNKYLHKLSALMKYAIDNELRAGPNPALKVALPHKHSIDDRDAFSITQLRAIFGSELFLEAATSRHLIGHSARFWLPLLALFMGLRQGEACQLLFKDFRNINGIDYIKISDDEGRRLKTEDAKRNVPCHPELLRLGLMEVVRQAEESTSGRLFPEERLGEDGHFSPYSKRFGRFLKSVGAKEKKTSFHSFRHNFRDALTEADVSPHLAFALGGWKEGWTKTGNLYGSRPDIARLFQAIAKVKFDGLNNQNIPTAKHARAERITGR